ncbi:hypothetical protein SRB5_33260 [Streptomyces sp. RB5]|uniref:Lincosamide nucleotidyltransferase-like C-terminal domain-containing protein n=1 Tax=Streptomyces smaragdinus TaxID=2585196 RepID=A0A7K0CIL0_9ACTN|nr:nucleotidyltransferase domain-containing protein [Streptomyces smaragdinus]MQY13183.1 hypothetical protein [Streptomyces smaragdinus]
MLVQEELIARTRRLCATDGRLDAALMYGSFAAGEGDAYSDIEFWLFFDPARLAEVDPREWCERVAPVRHLVLNEVGTYVAFFPGLVRGEFHFVATDAIAGVAHWPARGAAVERMVVKDRTGELTPVLEGLPDSAEEGDAEALCGRFANWLLLAHHVAARGELLRAWDALGAVQRHLLWLTRLHEGAVRHWLTPSRGAEGELSGPAYTALAEATAGAADVDRALAAAWRTGRALWRELGVPVPEELFGELDRALGQ